MDNFTSKKPLLLDFAEYLNPYFPELGGRILPVSEAEVTKTNVPTMPLCMLALTVAPFDHNPKGNGDIDITEDFIVEFWFATNKIKRTDQSESPFWAFYNYVPLRDKFIACTRRYKSPDDYKIKIVSMDISSSDLAVMVTFRCQHEFCWCEPEEFTKFFDEEPFIIGKSAKIEYSLLPSIETECCPEPACEEDKPTCP